MVLVIKAPVILPLLGVQVPLRTRLLGPALLRRTRTTREPVPAVEPLLLGLRLSRPTNIRVLGSACVRLVRRLRRPTCTSSSTIQRLAIIGAPTESLMSVLLIPAEPSLPVPLLYVARLLRHGARRATRARRLVHRRVLDERLRNTIARVVRRAIILVLGVWVVVVGHGRGRVSLRLVLCRLRRLLLLLRSARVGRRKPACRGRRLSLVTRQAFDIFVAAKNIASTEPSRLIAVVESLGERKYQC